MQYPALRFLAIACACCLDQAIAADGSFDPAWGGGGRMAFDGDNRGAPSSVVEKISALGDGTLLLAGTAGQYINDAFSPYWWLGHVSASGGFIAGFGDSDGSGRISECALGFDCANQFDGFADAAMQADGRIVVLGSKRVSRTAPGAHAFDASGVTGGTGQTTNQFTINNAGAQVTADGGLALRPSGAFVVGEVGNVWSDTGCPPCGYCPPSFGLAALDTALALDLNFNAVTDAGSVTFGGGQYVNAGSYSTARRVAVQSNGGIIMAGFSAPDGSGNVALLVTRLNADGSIDSSFGGGQSAGVVTMMTTGMLRTERPPAMFIDRADRITIAFTGFDTLTSHYGMGVDRLEANGTEDPNFYSFNETFPACPAHNVRAYALAPDSAGRILVAGICDNEFGVERLRGDYGTLDATFGINGFSHGSFSASSTLDDAFAIMFDGSGHPVLGGGTTLSGVTESGLARLTYDLIYTNGLEKVPAGCLPPDCGVIITRPVRSGIDR